MVHFRTQHQTEGEQSVSAGDVDEYEVEDEYRRVVGIDLVGDVEREVYVDSKDGSRFDVFGSTIRGQGDVELAIELEKGDTLGIEYLEAGTVSDVWLIRTDPPMPEQVAHRLAEKLRRET